MSWEDWITLEGNTRPDTSVSAIYLWRIGGDSYIGKATTLGSRFREYINNVRKLENGQPYRKSKPDQFRPIHRALFEAKRGGLSIEWKVLEVCEPGPHLLSRERFWIAELKPTLNGPRKLNWGNEQ